MLVRFDKVSLAFGTRQLLDQVSFQVEAGERVCLIGRNGEGKSSLLQLLMRTREADSGNVWMRPAARLSYLQQDIVADSADTVAEVVLGGLAGMGEALIEYQKLAGDDLHHAAHQRRLDELHRQLDAGGGWQLQQRLDTVLTRLGLSPDVPVSSLSGGWRRRTLLARALISEPDILLLDEPTNHLDIATVEWLESMLLEFSGSLLFVSHDRSFINNVATRLLELDRGHMISIDGNFDRYVVLKAELLAAEATRQAEFDKKLAAEEVWIRKGVEARRTRNEGRVRALYQLREQRRARRDRTGRIALQQHSANESGALVFEAEHVSVRFGERSIIRDFSVRIMRGDRIGLLGSNGSGKSTLLKTLLGQLEPSSGKVTVGSRLEIAYYDQERMQLNLDESVMENVAGNHDYVRVNGENRHISGYLRDFLFRPEQLNTPARALSGGERNRLLLARLFAQPSNVLVMDEPTNDLDIDTLELLEEFVAAYVGTVLIVSHDRTFLDHVVTDLLVLDGTGAIQPFVGGYHDWIKWRDEHSGQARSKSRGSTTSKQSGRPAEESAARSVDKPRKLTYKLQRELMSLPDQIQALEAERSNLEEQLADPQLSARGVEAITECSTRLASTLAAIDAAYARWSELENLSQG